MKIFNKTYKAWHVIYEFFGIKYKTTRHFEQKDKLNIVFDEKSGIGNRIFGLINCINQVRPKEINFYWDKTSWVSAGFYELFYQDFPFKLNEFNDLDEMKSKINFKNHTTIEIPPCDLRTIKHESLSLKYNEISKENLEDFNNFFKHLKPSEKVKKRMEDVKEDNFIALQIRNAPDWGSYGRNESLNDFFSEIDKHPKKTKFYLCAMNKKTSDTFKERYKERIIELPEKNYSSMIDAAADLFNMAKAKEAIYSYGSTFCELAFWLNFGTQKVKIIGSNSNWKNPCKNKQGLNTIK